MLTINTFMMLAVVFFHWLINKELPNLWYLSQERENLSLILAVIEMIDITFIMLTYII